MDYNRADLLRCIDQTCKWWCGLSDTENEGSWVNANTKEVTMVKSTSLFWRDGHQEVDLTYTIWGANEPNGREYENCIETRLRSFPNGTMRYVTLYAPLSHKFLCKIWFSNTTRAFNFHCRYVLWNDASCENNDLKFFCEFSDVPVFHLRGLSDCQVQCNIWHSKVSSKVREI